MCDGVELDAVQLRSLFEPFASSDEARTAGFGLSVCSSIVDQLGGQITAESLPGTGLSLTITFPCTRPSPTTEPPPPSSQHSSSPPSTASGSARILVIDDDPGVGRALRLMLEEDLGFLRLNDARVDGNGHLPSAPLQSSWVRSAPRVHDWRRIYRTG